MKKLVTLLMLILSASLFAEEQHPQIPTGQQLGGVIVTTKGTATQPHRVPANVDILLIIGDSDVTIRFNGDFGIGTYQLTDISTGNSISNTIDVCAGYSEVISFISDTASSIEFSMVFEDGSFCRLSWN